MNNIISIAKEEIMKLEKLLKETETFLSEAPEGCLKWQNVGAKTYYYQQHMVHNKNNTGKERTEVRRKYIKKNNMDLARLLAKKHYYELVNSFAENKLDTLKLFVNRYPDNSIDELYEGLSEERKRLILPVEITTKEKVRRWQEEEYEQTTMYSENLKFETEQGELVRSKSEVIIANILFQHQEDILYKYERPLCLKMFGYDKNIYPDFTIMNVHTGKITYWEHAGRMDDVLYSEEFVRKMNLYVANNLLPGRDIILTFESLENPLDIGVVKKLVRSLI